MNTINKLANNGIVWHLKERDELGLPTITVIRKRDARFPAELERAMAEEVYFAVALSEVEDLLVEVYTTFE